MFRYSQGFYTDGTALPVLPTSAAGVKEAPTIGAVAAWTRTVSSSIVNDFRYGFTRTVIMDTFADPFGTQEGGNAKLGIPGGQLAPGFSGLTIGEGLTVIGTAGILSDGKDNKFHLSETLSWAKGSHFFRFGANGVRYQQNRFYSGNNGALGTFGYTTTLFSGSSFSDFLLDMVSAKGRGQGDGRRWGQRHWRFGTFVQDDWKATSTLTLNLGLRWEYTQPLYEVNDLQSNIDVNTGQLLLAGQNGNSRALYDPYYKQFMPRIGFAWTPEALGRRLVVRGAYGITSFLEGTGVNLRLPLNPPFFFESNQNYDLTSGASSSSIGFSDLPQFTRYSVGQHPNLGSRPASSIHAAAEFQPRVSACIELRPGRRLCQPARHAHNRRARPQSAASRTSQCEPGTVGEFQYPASALLSPPWCHNHCDNRVERDDELRFASSDRHQALFVWHRLQRVLHLVEDPQ